jgi:outer membrane protein OmpA-like peptidoglycan-associated protein
MAVRIEKGGWVLIFLIGLGLVGYSGYKYGWLEKIIPAARTREAAVPPKADLPPLNVSMTSGYTPPALTTPGSKAGCANLPEVRLLHWAWNAQMGLMFATGGSQATNGSLMCKNEVNLRLIREDMPDKMQEQLISFATALKGGDANPSKGAHFVAIMGDGGAAFLRGLNEALKRIGPEYTAKVVGSAGYSRGEDKFMGPPEWKANPAASRGGVVTGVLRDGDWNIALKWLGDNGLCNNANEKTYDPNCLNWVATSDYIDAAEKYVADYCENRAVVKAGRETGETRKVCVNGVVTWTPGDVIVAQKKGGLVSIVSTREYSSQMPNVIIGIDKWMKENRASVEGLLKALTDGGDQVKAHPAALKHAAEVSAQVYNERNADAAYWERYYHGVTERDKKGLNVELGGSTVNNLADNLMLFGLAQNSANIFAATYRVFGDIVVSQYPDLVPNYPPVNEILDTSYLEAVARREAPRTAPDQPRFTAGERVRQVVSRRSWQITFETGSASFTSAAERELEQLLRDLLVAGSTAVEIHGHTDSVGNPQSNKTLSERRAFAIKEYLEKQAPASFPEGRVRIFAHGQDNPVAPNSTAEGRARNRRVEIVLGTTGA